MLWKPLLFLCLLLPAFLQGQSDVDSLYSLLSERELADTSRVQVLLAFYDTDLYYSNQDTVLQFSYQALELSESIRYQRGQTEALTTLGGIYRLRSEKDSALSYYRSAIELAERIGFTKGMINGYMGLGNTYNQISDWLLALLQFDKVDSIARQANDSIQIASVNNNMGNTYLNQAILQKALEHYQIGLKLGDDNIKKVTLINIAVVYTSLNMLDKAREYYQEAIVKQGANGNPYHLAFVYKNLGILEKKDENYEEAVGYFNNALEISRSLSDDYQVSELLYSLGNLFFEQNEFSQALLHYKQSLNIQEEIQHRVGQCFSLIAIGGTYYEMGEYDRAIPSLLSADVIADEIQMLTAKSDIAQTLSLIYARMEVFSKAYVYEKQFKKLNDSLNSIRSQEKITELEEKYQNEQKQQEINLLSAENEIANLEIIRQENQRNYLVITSILLVVLTLIIYNRYQIKAKANGKLKELDHLKTTFFTNISHEFRTPLTLILSPAQKLLGQIQKPEVKKEVQHIHHNAVRLHELTNQLLDLSKLEAGKLELRIQQNNFKEFMQTVVASFESLADSRRIDFAYDLENIPVEACYDEDKVQKIINNILSNAFRFTPAEGKVRLTAGTENHQVVITITDTGSGIPKEELKNIFRRFHQAKQKDNSTTGTGIGLTLTRELARLHHGEIAVESEEGKGSTFTFSFPYGKASYAVFEWADQPQVNRPEMKSVDARIEEGADQSVELAENSQPLILVVEDNDELRNHMCGLLSGEYMTKEAANGKEGIALALEYVPDIIVSDVMMPEMDGIELCNEIKANEKTSHIPVILLTAKADRETKLEGLKTGADDYISKPFDNEELAVRIQNLVAQRAKLITKFSRTLRLEPSRILVASPDEAFIQKALSFVNEHISDSTLTVEIFQKEMAMSRMQLHRKLKALTGFSASEFIRHLRLKRAAQLLADNAMNVNEVAFSCGFNSLSYFTTCFKEEFGTIPSKYLSKQASES